MKMPSHQGAGRLLKIQDVIAQTTLSRRTIYRRMKEGSFPQSRPIGRNRVAWAEAEIESWKRDPLANIPAG